MEFVCGLCECQGYNARESDTMGKIQGLQEILSPVTGVSLVDIGPVVTGVWSLQAVTVTALGPTFYEVQSAYRKCDLCVSEARVSGFVGPADVLAYVSPVGRVSFVKA